MRPEAALMVEHTLIPPMLIIQKQQTRLTLQPLANETIQSVFKRIKELVCYLSVPGWSVFLFCFLLPNI